MSHNITIRADGRATMAFRGDRNDIWHRLGNQYQDGWTIADWADNSDLAWEAVKYPAYAEQSDGMRPVPNRWFVGRGDNGHILSEGTVTDQYQIAQPRSLLNFFEQYVSVDPRFRIDTAMSLKGGQLIAVTATFEDQTVAGEKHKARLLCTTSFDGTGSTLARGLMTRVVCNNTLDAGIAEKDKSVIRVRHSTKFDPKVAGAQLATIVQAFDKYKAMGEAMARWIAPSQRDISSFFKLTLDIPTDAKREDISTAKFNQFEKMVGCYEHGVRNEGLQAASGWAMLQGVTRYVDHEKTVRGSDGTQRGDHETRLVAANFGAGAVMKEKAVGYLNDMSDGALLKAVASVTAQSTAARRQNDDVAAILAQPLRRSW